VGVRRAHHVTGPAGIDSQDDRRTLDPAGSLKDQEKSGKSHRAVYRTAGDKVNGRTGVAGSTAGSASPFPENAAAAP
jgi:hypothetical protein